MTTNTSSQPPSTTERSTRDRPMHSRRAQDLTAGDSPSAATNPVVSPSTDNPDGSSGADRSVSVWTVLLFIVGCATLVVAAWNLPNLARWGDDYGTVLVFLAFFIVMSIGGRLFWAGIDAMWNAVRGKGNS